MVTGGTGFVGAHTVAALLAAGHEVRMLARDPARVADTVGTLTPAAPDVVRGDMTDEAAVAAALAGCDAAIHAAAVVSMSRRNAEVALATNVRGTQVVLGTAERCGIDPIVHVSSVAAVFAPAAASLHPDLPPTTRANNPYTRSKALTEGYARERQAAGAPLTIVYPGGVQGPAAGAAFGQNADGLVATLKTGAVVLKQGIWPLIDVRDLASILVALMQPGRGPRRYMCGGHALTLPEMAGLLGKVTGRRIPVLPVPGSVFRGLGRAVDALTRLVPFETVFTGEAMELLTRGVPTDDRPVQADLGITFRDPAETLRAAVHDLFLAGRLSGRQAGLAAN